MTMRGVGLVASGCDFRPTENLSRLEQERADHAQDHESFHGSVLLAPAGSKSKATQLAPIQSTAFTPKPITSADGLTKRDRGGDNVGNGRRGCDPDRQLPIRAGSAARAGSARCHQNPRWPCW